MSMAGFKRNIGRSFTDRRGSIGNGRNHSTGRNPEGVDGNRLHGRHCDGN